MEYNVGAAIVAGVVGGAAMAILLYMGIAMMPGQMKMNQFRLLGTMMLPDGVMAYIGGGMMHAGIKKGIIGAPGAFARGYPMMTVGGFLMLHLLFGLLVGLVYGALV